MGRLQGSKNLSIDLEEKIIALVGIRITRAKVVAYNKVLVSIVKTIVRRHRLLSSGCVKKVSLHYCS